MDIQGKLFFKKILFRLVLTINIYRFETPGEIDGIKRENLSISYSLIIPKGFECNHCVLQVIIILYLLFIKIILSVYVLN